MESVSDSMTKVIKLLADVETGLLYDLGPNMMSASQAATVVNSPGMPEMKNGLDRARK